MNTKKQNKKKKGFTLIELIIVIAIIAILAAIAIPNFLSIQKKSKAKADIASAKTLYDATSVLITEGKIVPDGTNDIIFTLTPPSSTNNDTDGTITPTGGTDPTNNTDYAQALKQYLQTIPAVKTDSDSNFEVIVSGTDEEPTIQVKLKNGAVVYPNGTGAFDINGDGTGSTTGSTTNP